MDKQTEVLIEGLNSKILDFSGIYVAKSQYESLANYIIKRAEVKEISVSDYCNSLTADTLEFDRIINQVTVNETYFFREVKQFEFLEKEVFPQFMGKNLTIWTCCCSTGEEPLSLLALASSMNINLTIYASDIDDNALKIFSRGLYSTYSLRSDGQKYHKLLDSYSQKTESQIIFRPEFLNRIHSFKFNLIQDEISSLPFAEEVDIIFMRNVFIYFDKETRKMVTNKVCQRLKKNGILFFSMNEIGSIDKNIIPDTLHKKNNAQVYYFEKGEADKKTASQIIASTELKRKEKESQIAREKVRREVEKIKQQKLEQEKLDQEKLEQEKFDQERVLSEKVKKESSKKFDAKQTYEMVCMEINRGDFEKARLIARGINGPDEKKYSFFMLGYIEYHADNRAEAENFFASAESLSPGFWPAVFYHGMVLRDLGKTESALKCFSKCKNLINNFGKDLPYDFALDSFSPAYISSLCEIFSNGGRM